MSRDDEIIQKIDRDAMAKRARVRELIADAGRLDILADFDKNMREIDLGIMGARNVWHSLSKPQRDALKIMVDGDGRAQRRNAASQWYDGHRAGNRFYGQIARLPTVRNLIARDLVACEGGAFDPECAVSITERGRFVVKHGPQPKE